MELRQLRSFVMLAGELHFGRAARRLNIVQPALSKQIKALEDELGGPLLLRGRRSVALTEAGRLFLAEAELALRHAAAAADMARRVNRGDAGRFRIGYSASAIHSGVYSVVVDRVRRAHPQVDLVVGLIDPWLQIDRLLAGDIDVAFGPMPLGLVPDTVSARVVATLPVSVALPAGHRLATHAGVVAADLRHEAFVEYADGQPEGHGIVERLLGFTPAVVRSARDPLAALAQVEAGRGVSVLPSAAAQPCFAGIVFRPILGAGDLLKVTMLGLKQPGDPLVRRVCATIEAITPARPATAPPCLPEAGGATSDALSGTHADSN